MKSLNAKSLNVKSLKGSVLAGAVLSLLSGVSHADIPSNQTGYGGVFLTVYNDTASAVTYLGITLDQFLNPQVSSGNAQGALNDGLLSYQTDVSVFGGNLADVQYIVSAGWYTGWDPTTWSVAFTGTEMEPSEVYMDGDALSNMNNAIANFVPQVNNACGNTNPCVAPTPMTDGFANNYFVEYFNGGATIPTNSAIGTDAAFYYSYGLADINPEPAAVIRYGTADGYTVVNLSSTGLLTFTTPTAPTAPVPLPAAAWLLISGLAGLGAVGRRRNAA